MVRALRCESILMYMLCLSMIAVVSLISSCGYRMTGSRSLPFDSISIRPVINNTFEPGLEETLHNALSREFIAQGVKVIPEGGGVYLAAVITKFRLRPIAAIDERVQEQEVVLRVDVQITDRDNVVEFPSMASPIRITFQSSGTVSESVVQKERAIDKACAEIARELISKVVIRYAQ